MKFKRVYTEKQRLAKIAEAARWAKENPEKRRAITRRYYARHRDRIRAEYAAKSATTPKKVRPPTKGRDPEKAKVCRQRWMAKSRDKKNAAQRARRAANLIEVRAKEVIYRRLRAANLKAAQRRWADRNPEAKRSFVRLRRARKRGACGFHTAGDIQLIRQSQRDRCAYCRIKLDSGGHVDHIVALTKGGSNWPKNLQLLCGSCNSSKCNRDPIDFARSRGRLL